MCIILATESVFHYKTQCLTCERWGGNLPPNIFSERTPPSSFPFSVAHIWTTPNGKKKGGVEKGRERGGKKNLEMFSSGCNLSLSWLQHSRVIRQHSPVRRTEVALCLGLTQAHIHLKPLLSLGCHNRRCCRWAARRYLVFFFSRSCVHAGFRAMKSWILPSRAFEWCCSCDETVSS